MKVNDSGVRVGSRPNVLREVLSTAKDLKKDLEETVNEHPKESLAMSATVGFLAGLGKGLSDKVSFKRQEREKIAKDVKHLKEDVKHLKETADRGSKGYRIWKRIKEPLILGGMAVVGLSFAELPLLIAANVIPTQLIWPAMIALGFGVAYSMANV